MKLEKILAGLVMVIVALVARAETDPAALKTQIRTVQAETKELRAQTKALKEAQQGPLLAAKLSKATMARDKARAALVKAQTTGGVK